MFNVIENTKNNLSETILDQYSSHKEKIETLLRACNNLDDLEAIVKNKTTIDTKLLIRIDSYKQIIESGVKEKLNIKHSDFKYNEKECMLLWFKQLINETIN